MTRLQKPEDRAVRGGRNQKQLRRAPQPTPTGGAEQALHESTERLRLAVEGGQMGLWDWDLATNRVRCSEREFELFGLPKQEVAVDVESLFRLIHPKDVPRLRRTLRVTIRKHAEFHQEFRVIRPDGSVCWLAGKGTVSYDSGGRPRKLTGVTYDITVQKHAEHQLRARARTLEQSVAQRTAELVAANRTLLEEIGRRRELESEFLKVSEREKRRLGEDVHDGLCQITAAAAMMGANLQQDLSARSLRQQARAARRITRLIHSVSDEARRLARGLSPVRLGADGLMMALTDLASSTKRLFRTPCRLRCPAPVLVADHAVATHLFRIAQEAVNNAIRHAKPRHVRIVLEHRDASLVLTVADDGCGVPAELRPGQGMGLHVMRHRAEMIGGHVRFERGRKGGTMVVCRVPLPVDGRTQNKDSPGEA
jgi:PAS domain S-box-containing protein